MAGLSFDPVHSMRVLQVRRSLGANHVKHTTMHLPQHHSLPLFPFALPTCPLSLFFSHPSSSCRKFSFFSFIPFLASRSRRTFSDALQTCHRLSRPLSSQIFYYPLQKSTGVYFFSHPCGRLTLRIAYYALLLKEEKFLSVSLT